MIDKHAIIDASAQIANNVHIGPFTVIGPNVHIDEGSWIGPHVVIQGPTTIGKDNKIFQFSSIGEATQDKKYNGEPTRLEIGDRNIFRECSTVHRGTMQGGMVTRIGNDNLFMAYTHVAHDCIIGNHIIFSNNASIAGHVTIDDHAQLGGFAGVHQFCHIGTYSFSAGGSIIVKDVLPYITVSGYPAEVHGLNTVGLERNGFSADKIASLRRAYKIIFRKNLTIKEAIVELEEMSIEAPEISILIGFLSQSSRGITR